MIYVTLHHDTFFSFFFSYGSRCHFQGPTSKQFYSPLVPFVYSFPNFPIDKVTVSLETFASRDVFGTLFSRAFIT